MKQRIAALRDFIIDLPAVYKRYGEDYCFVALQELIVPFKALYYNKESKEHINDIKRQFQEILLPLLHESELLRHIHQKPLGYAGDYMTQIMIWNGRTDSNSRFLGNSMRGQLLSALTLRMANCIANELRIHHLKSVLAQGATSVLSVGCGPAIEYWDNSNFDLEEIYLLDQEKEALAYCRNKIGCNILKKTTFIKQNILKFILKTNRKRYGYIYLYGLLDYFTIDNSRKIISRLWENVKSGGAILLTNAHESNDTRAWMEFAGEWI
ncbi:MAG: methyltransferase domain-containing protein, partial [Chitinivibrionales bacterium]|nr:methyltransferase domain-containing protein [Chitinivibrionales bacterium]